MAVVIDVHTHPHFFAAINPTPEALGAHQQALGLPKAGVAPLQHIFNQMNCAHIDQIALLPLDLTNREGGPVVSNEEVQQIVALAPDHFIGFASVDPARPDAAAVLAKAFGPGGLAGLKLHPSRQGFAAASPQMDPIYDLCVQYNKPIIFHAGLSLEPQTNLGDGNPLQFEAVAQRFPKLRLCLAHFGWPWVKETAALLLKYPNMYADTGLLYFDSAAEFYQRVFTQELGPHWIDRSLRHQVMFGSNNPRFEQIRMIEALRRLDWRPSTLELVLGGNAQVFLGRS